MKGPITVVTMALYLLAPPLAGADSIRAEFANNQDAEKFVQSAQNAGRGKGAVVVHNADGSTSVTLPDVAVESMSDTAMEAISENATSIDMGPAIPTEVMTAISTWFDGFVTHGNATMYLTTFDNGFEYAGCIGTSAIGFDRSNLGGNAFFAYLRDEGGPFIVVAEVSALDPILEDAIKSAIEEEAGYRSILINPC